MPCIKAGEGRGIKRTVPERARSSGGDGGSKEGLEHDACVWGGVAGMTRACFKIYAYPITKTRPDALPGSGRSGRILLVLVYSRLCVWVQRHWLALALLSCQWYECAAACRGLQGRDPGKGVAAWPSGGTANLETARLFLNAQSCGPMPRSPPPRPQRPPQNAGPMHGQLTAPRPWPARPARHRRRHRRPQTPPPAAPSPPAAPARSNARLLDSA